MAWPLEMVLVSSSRAEDVFGRYDSTDGLRGCIGGVAVLLLA